MVAPDYAAFEALLSLNDYAPQNGNERILVGDIASINPVANQTGMGMLMMRRYMAIILEGIPTELIDRLSDHPQMVDGAWDMEARPDLYDKRRYCIPLERLKEVVPSFDIEKALDKSLVYQPFRPVDEETGLYLETDTPPLDVHGLLFDKVTGEYL